MLYAAFITLAMTPFNLRSENLETISVFTILLDEHLPFAIEKKVSYIQDTPRCSDQYRIVKTLASYIVIISIA